ncbi:MAG: hypothetical protein METHAR1v1_1740010 [Methanothrix sp.]|jgi:hypothetical protein|nr:MAG: hypothetical protein METHAR1v1_1740010 [Methanothrix sp.]
MPRDFKEEVEVIERSMEDFRGGKRRNVAVISDPFYGESELLDQVWEAAASGAFRVKAGSLKEDFEILERSSAKIVVVEEAHRLYLRKIGGFDLMDRFMNFVSSSDRLFITTWNSFSWKYLDEVLGIGQHFPLKVVLPRMDAGEIRDMLLSGYEEGELTFLEEETEERGEPKIFKRSSFEIRLLSQRIEIPRPVADLGSVRSRLQKKEDKRPPMEAFFGKLARISDGNPGVADLLWKEALDYPEVRDCLTDPPSIDLDLDDSFALSIILSMGSLDLADLSEVLEPVGTSAERAAALLEERGLVFIDGEVVSLRAEALKRTAEHLRRVRLVW